MTSMESGIPTGGLQLAEARELELELRQRHIGKSALKADFHG
jgi:hypothetical protein